MKKYFYLFPCIVFVIIFLTSCNLNTEKKEISKQKSNKQFVSDDIMLETILTLASFSRFDTTLNGRDIKKGVEQVAALWEEKDGSELEFQQFCFDNFIIDTVTLLNVYKDIERNFEILFGYNNKIQVKLMEPIHLDMGETTKVTEILSTYSPSAHIIDDMFDNKLAFLIILNFPAYSLEEKKENMDKWSRLQWAYARLGDLFVSRTPAELLAKAAKAEAEADTYISEYNIYMNKLVNNNMEPLFNEKMALNSHWGLRDELKANYADKNKGFEKQKIIYEVMKKIISQDIPKEVINSDEYFWNPVTNQIYKNSVEHKGTKEEYKRYEYWMWNFKAQRAIDKHNPIYPTFIKRAYDKSMELNKEEIESIFINFISSPEIKQLSSLIKNRLGRNLEPFDIWYDGFKSRSNIDENKLTAITSKKYPNQIAFQSDIAKIINNMGWDREKAEEIANRITVDPAKGSGHAWGAEMKGDFAHLRTRIQKTGMDYKGYNIAIHELGHNVEQTITLYDMDYYFLHGVPNTAFTEAVAFMFQNNDLKLLGQQPIQSNKTNEALAALDNCWNAYEIMGVALVDMYTWQWLYDHPDANLLDFKNAVEKIAKDVWNKYYAPVFGVEDSTILAIYSHLICTPMYLANYPIGHLIEFQIEKYIKNKKFANEITRMLLAGKVIPQKWMKDAIKSEISGQATLNAVKDALIIIN